MKNIFKLLFASLLVSILFVACDNDADRDWTTPEASFKLYDTTLGSNVLYETMKNNPFVLTWDKASSSDYTVVFSTTEDFANKITLGTAASNTFTTTIGDINSKFLTAGVSPYASTTVYVRVEAGSEISNTISFAVTPYPISGPIITAPTAGMELVLNINNQNATATTVTWNDYSQYGVSVKYLVEIAAKGSTTFMSLGEVTIPSPNLGNIAKSLSLTHKVLNDAILKTGAQANVQSEFDVRITATTESTGGTISLTSAVSTIKVTPFVNNVTLYLIGDATAGEWNNSTANDNMYPLLGNHAVSTSYTYTGYFKVGGFKLIKDKGNWDNQYGAGSSAGTLSSSGNSGNINVTAAGYYKLTVDVSTLTYTLVSVSTPTVTYPTVGIIGSSTTNGWNSSTAMTKSTFDPHIWYLTNVNLTNGELKFRANDAWDVSWGSSDADFGTGNLGGANIPVAAGVYNIYFNDNSGAYTLIKQ